MNKKRLIIISAIVVTSVLLVTLFATGIIPLGVYNDIPSDTGLSNENEIEDSIEGADSEQNLVRQDLETQDTSDGDIPIAENSEDIDDNKMPAEQEHYKKPENKVEVLNNTPEYEVEMYSYLDDSKNLYLAVDYYFDGVSQSVVFGQNDFPKLEDIMKIGSEDLSNDKAEVSNEENYVTKLSNAILNTKYGKIYFIAERNLQGGEKAFLLYVLSLKDKNIKFLYQGEGYSLNASMFSPDKEYIAFNHFRDEKGNSSLIHIFSSKDDAGIIIDNMTSGGKLIGTDLSQDDLLKEGKTVSYYLIRWRTLEDLKLREYSYVFDETQNLIKDEQSYEVSYNILENTMICPEEKYAKDAVNQKDDTVSNGEDDVTIEESIVVETPADKNDSSGEESTETNSNESTGTGSDPETSTEKKAENDINVNPDEGSDLEADTGSETDPEIISGKEDSENKSSDKMSSDSEPVTILKSFYKYVTEGNYEKAYDLFDDNFQSASKMFMGFKISKAEITLELFQAFAEATAIFSNVKVEEIVKEEQSGDDYKIYYSQSIVIYPNNEPQIYPLVVTLKKMAGTWKITAVDDGTWGVEPF